MNQAIKELKISIVMPAYNAEKYISQAVESILEQTFKDFELIIIDDGSSDNTWSIITGYANKDQRIVPIRNKKNLKICRTLNHGLQVARGQYIARMDADDWSYPDRLVKQHDYMEAHTGVGVSGAAILVCDENLRELNQRSYKLTDSSIRHRFFFYNPFCHPVTIWRREVFSRAGNYNEDLYDVEDYDLYFRVGRYYKFGNLPDVLLKYRTSQQSVSNQRARRQEKLTLFIRYKAVAEYGYRMRLVDKLYWAGQLFSHYLMPSRFKFWLFNWLRK